MTRCTAEVAVLPSFSAYPADEVERQMDDAWMCQALSGPQPAPDVRRLFLDLHDVLVDVEFAALLRLEDAHQVCFEARVKVREWFMSTVAGLPRIELDPEDLWALFQLVDRVSVLVERFDTAPPPVPTGTWGDRDVTYADFDEPAYVRVVS